MSSPKNQHDVPSTYLKHWAVSVDQKKIVEVLRIHHIKKIEQKSIDANFFKNRDFYTVKTENPFVIEEVFRDIIEPSYQKIISVINQEKKITKQIKHDLIYWLWYSKFRNLHQRRIIEQHFDFISAMKIMYGNNNIEIPDLNTNQDVSKKVHLQAMFDEKLIKEFKVGMMSKHWIILKSKNDNQFITNDNPGFSVNMDMGIVNHESANVQFATIPAATNYYPLSPKFCLMISPYWAGTPTNLNMWNLKIRYVETNERHVNFINQTTYMLMRKFCISNKREFLENYINIDLPAQKDYSKLPMIPIGGVIVREGEEYLTKKNRKGPTHNKG